MMVAILRANPQAFYMDNVSALKKGVILRIPTASELDAVSVSEAQSVVRSHVAAWQDLQVRGATRPTTVADAGQAQRFGADGGGSASAMADRLELVAPRRGEGQGGADRPGPGGADRSAEQVRALRQELQLAQEELASSRKEKDELRSRVSDLEKIAADRQRLVDLANDRIAELQARLRELEAQRQAQANAPAPEPIASPAPPPARPEPVAPPSPAPAPSTATVTRDDIWGSTPAPEPEPEPEAADDAATAAAPAPVDTAPVVETPPPDPTPIEAPAPAPVSQPETRPIAETPPAQPEAIEPAASPWWMSPWLLGGLGALLLGGIGFAVLGRRKSAAAPGGVLAGAAATAPPIADEETALRARLIDHPGDLTTHLELLMLYYGRNDVAAFTAAAESMYAHVQDPNAPEWQQALQLGSALAPDHYLFAPAPSAPSSHATVEQPALSGDEGLGPLDLGHFEDTTKTAEVRTESPAASAGDGFSFDFDLAEAQQPTQRIEPVPEPEPSKAADEFAFDFNFEPTAAPASAPSNAVPEPAPELLAAPEPPPIAEPAPDLARASFSGREPTPTKDTEFATLDLPDLDFTSAEVKAPEVTKFAAADIAPTAAVSVDAELTTPELIRESDMPTLDDSFLSGSDSVGTKLDLARAYLDMGDPEGARSMLEEVLAEGSEAQRNEAREMLGRLG